MQVVGNYVDGVAIAGQVQIAQFSLEANSGMIKSLDNDGKITLEGGQVVRINDPNAVFSAGYKSQPEFTADDVNPSVTGKPDPTRTAPSDFADTDTSIAFSGFPMCVPRSSADPKCPSTNRPAGRTSFNAPDPLTMAPLLPGDYIEFEGIKVGGEIIAYGMVAPSVQILTPNGPTYLRVEEAIIGVFDTQNNGVVEFADSRVIGYSSNSGDSITISRMEIDPCTGEVNDVPVGTALPKGDRNKWTWRSSSSSLIKYAREYKATASTGTKETNGGQILAGQYVAPIAEWVSCPCPLSPKEHADTLPDLPRADFSWCVSREARLFPDDQPERRHRSGFQWQRLGSAQTVARHQCPCAVQDMRCHDSNDINVICSGRQWYRNTFGCPDCHAFCQRWRRSESPSGRHRISRRQGWQHCLFPVR
jgi:hypothetical protein